MTRHAGNLMTRAMWKAHGDFCEDCAKPWTIFDWCRGLPVPQNCQYGRKLYLQWVNEDAWKD